MGEKIWVGRHTVNGSDTDGWRVLEQFGAYRITKPFKTQAKAIKHAEMLTARQAHIDARAFDIDEDRFGPQT